MNLEFHCRLFKPEEIDGRKAVIVTGSPEGGKHR
jgi:hypothetical protein